MAYLYQFKTLVSVLPANKEIHYQLRAVTIPLKWRYYSDGGTPVAKIFHILKKSLLRGVLQGTIPLLDKEKAQVVLPREVLYHYIHPVSLSEALIKKWAAHLTPDFHRQVSTLVLEANSWEPPWEHSSLILLCTKQGIQQKVPELMKYLALIFPKIFSPIQNIRGTGQARSFSILVRSRECTKR